MKWFHYLLCLFCVAMAVWTVTPATISPCDIDRSHQSLLFGLYKTHCTFTPYSTAIALGLAIAVIVWGVVARRKAG